MKDNNISKAEMINNVLMIIKKQNKLLNEIDYEYLIDEDIKKLYRVFNNLDKKVDQIFSYYKDCPINKHLINKVNFLPLTLTSNFIFEWQEITPYIILDIEEKKIYSRRIVRNSK